MDDIDENVDWYSPETATFGDRVVGAREAAGMTQKVLSKRLGIKTKTLVGWENDLAEPRANKLQMLAGVLNVSIVWLLTGEGDDIAAPDDTIGMDRDVKGLLAELRELREQAKTLAERVGSIEKRLRSHLSSDA